MKFNILSYTSVVLIFTSLLIACNKEEKISSGCPNVGILESFTTPDGLNVIIYQDGSAYTIENDICTFALQYFDPYFAQDGYLINSTAVYLITNSGLFPTKSNYLEDFENYDTFTDLFINSFSDTNLYWDSFTLQSPLAPEVEDYVALRQCILDGSCTFLDNRIELVNDPINSSNQVLKFTSVAPSDNMVTAKSSISSSINYFVKDSDVWFSADFFIESGMPFSIVDFENSYFDQHPGPRVVIRDNKLELENKFGAKLNYENNSGITVPQNQWFTLKVHLKYSNEDDGIIELWQDGVQIIAVNGINLPSSNSIQNILEVGVSATPIGCEMLLDNMRISETPF